MDSTLLLSGQFLVYLRSLTTLTYHLTDPTPQEGISTLEVGGHLLNLELVRILSDTSPAANGLYAGGGLIGSLCLHWSINKFGRRPTIQVLCVVAIISAILQGAAVHIAMFLIGRFVNGLGVGAIDVAVPLYQSELSPAKQRGRMVGSHGFLVVCGYVSVLGAVSPFLG